MLIAVGSVYVATSPRPASVVTDAGRPPPVPFDESERVNEAGPPSSAILAASDAPADLGACCRAGSEAVCAAARELPFSDGLACHTCRAGEKRPLPSNQEWSMWLEGLDDGPNVVPCARLRGQEVCAGATLGTQQKRGLRVTIDDIQQGRLSMTLVAPQRGEEIPPLNGTARIEGERLLSPALCEGAKLRVRVADEGRTRDVAVKVYLVKPREDDVR